MIPSLRIGATQAFITVLIVVVVFGTLHILATSQPGSKFTKVWVGVLGF